MRGSRRQFRANIRLPWEQSANPVIREDKKLAPSVFLSPQADLHPALDGRPHVFPGGFAPWTKATSADADADRQEPVDAWCSSTGPAHFLETWDEHVREHLLRDELISTRDLASTISRAHRPGGEDHNRGSTATSTRRFVKTVCDPAQARASDSALKAMK